VTAASVYVDIAAGLILGFGSAVGLHSAVVATALQRLAAQPAIDDEPSGEPR
jgi:hypothetical protein